MDALFYAALPCTQILNRSTRLARRYASVAAHLSTSFRAALTGFGACLTMVHLVFAALFPAALANFCAGRTNQRHRLAAAPHIGGSEPADRSTIDVDRNAPSHFLDVRFMETRGSAMITRSGASIAFIDAGLILSMHDLSFHFEVSRKWEA
jgi:hypothetical protein